VPIGKQNDQEMFAQVFLDGNLEGIQLDYYARVLQCMHMSQSDVELQRNAPQGESMAFNVRTKKRPSLLHFNGGSKGSFREVEGAIVGGDQWRIDGSTPVELEGGRKTMPYKKVCEQYPALWQ